MNNSSATASDQTNTQDLREDMLSVLRENICVFNFVKSDGTNRTMLCTLISDYLPERPVLEENSAPAKPRKRNPDNIVVWDVDIGDWRSFNIRSVTKWGIAMLDDLAKR